MIFPLLLVCLAVIKADLWVEMQRMPDLQQFRALAGTSKVAKAYLEDSNAKITVFAPIDDVFTHNPELRALRQEEILEHFVATQVIEIGSMNKKWDAMPVYPSTKGSPNISKSHQ